MDLMRPLTAVRHLFSELAAASQEYLGVAGRNWMTPCTCGTPRRHGRCPRHGTLS